MNKIVLIAGPTCSGKSRIALELAAALQGVVINADSMQVYQELPILSAQPSPEDQSKVLHLLYGHVSASEGYSVGRWLAEASSTIRAQLSSGKVPVVVGGTGLYFEALLHGLANVPEIPPFVRKFVREMAENGGVDAVRARLVGLEPEASGAIRGMDLQRLTRALEVRLATGRPLTSWQAEGRQGGFESQSFLPIVLLPKRAEVYEKCERRFDAMIKGGAIDEVEQLLSLGLPPSKSAMKALGVPHLARYIRHELSLDEAVDGAKTATRRYAKRQFTWISRHMISWNSVLEQDSERISEKIFSIIKENGLTMQ